MKERHSLSINEWHRSRLRLRFIRSNQGRYSPEKSSVLMMDQTNDIFSHRRILRFSRARSDIEQISMMMAMVRMKVISSHHIRSSEHTLQCTLLAVSFTHVSIVVKIAKDYFSSANGHISETKTHIDHHLSLQ